MQGFAEVTNKIQNYTFDKLDETRQHEFQVCKMQLTQLRQCSSCRKFFSLASTLGLKTCHVNPHRTLINDATRDHFCADSEDYRFKYTYVLPIWLVFTLYNEQVSCITRLFSDDKIQTLIDSLEAQNDTDTVAIPRIDVF